jgi:hypothetical protein
MKIEVLKSIVYDIISFFLALFMVLLLVGIPSAIGSYVVINYPDFLFVTIVGPICVIIEMFCGSFLDAEGSMSVYFYEQNYWIAYFLIFSLISWTISCTIFPAVSEYFKYKKKVVEFQIKEREENNKRYSKKHEN